jgi:(p)ppGpp synthase/HD superfamily hydrolase
MTPIERAKAFAETAHAGQTRLGRNAEPYITHVAEVAARVAGFGGTEAQVVAAWLHDTVEDCGVTLETLSADFGPEAAALVAEMTDNKSLPKDERKRLQIENAAKASDAAALIKICDKLANVRSVGDAPPVEWPPSRRSAYLTWAMTVVERLPAGANPARAAFAQTLARSQAILAAESPT